MVSRLVFNIVNHLPTEHQGQASVSPLLLVRHNEADGTAVTLAGRLAANLDGLGAVEVLNDIDARLQVEDVDVAIADHAD